MLREVGIRNSSPPQNKPHPPQNSGPTLSTASPTTPRHSSGRKVGPFCGTKRRIDRQQVGPLYRLKQVQDPIQVSSSLIGHSDKSESIFLPVIARRNRGASQEMGSGKGSESGNSRFLFPAIPSAQKERKVTPSNRPFLAKSVYIRLVILNSKGLSEILRDIHTSTYQICRSEEKNNSNNHI